MLAIQRLRSIGKKPIAAIAAQLRLSRPTVYKYLRKDVQSEKPLDEPGSYHGSDSPGSF